jgi:adenylate cyclase
LKKILLNPWTALLTLALITSVRIADPSFVESMRLRYFDTLITSKPIQTSTVATVNIDDAALEKYGQFPFSRDIYAHIIEDVYARGAGLVVFNIFMPDADRFKKDADLAKFMTIAPVVLPQTATNEPVKSETIAFRPGVSVIGNEDQPFTVNYENIQANTKELNDVIAGAGIVNTFPELDGVVRRMPMVISSKGKLYPSLGLDTLRVASGDPSFQVKISELGVEAVRIPKFGKIATDPYSRIWIDWSHQPSSDSITNLPESFNGKIVIIGLTARGLNNPVATARGEQFPHQLQGAVLDTLVSGTNIVRPDYADGAELLSFIVLAIGSIYLTRWKYGFVPIIGFICSLPYASNYAFTNYSILLDATFVVAGFGLVYAHAYTVKFVSELTQKLAIKKQFAGYCSKEVVEMLQKDPELIKRGVRKDVSVMFSDLRGFTPIGEHYGDNVAGLGEYMNGYMDSISRPIIDNNGMVIKYVGDASMHIHGAPIDDNYHARTIVKVGLEMLDAVDAYTKIMEEQGLPPAAMGWGCNSGIGFIGEMGSTDRHSYDILGDMVSTAARLEARCKAYGVLCIIGAETYNRTKEDFFYLMLDNLQPKGKTVADLIYTALRTKGADYSLDKDQHDMMHILYKLKRFDDAAAICKKMKGSFGGQMDKYYKMWIERCEFMKQQELGDNWNGEFIAHEK